MVSVRFIDLFAGIGGFRKGFDEAGGYKCVFTSEIDRHAQETYAANHSIDHPLAGDICAVPADSVPAHDLLVGGFPCQSFSVLGKGQGFADQKGRGNMFFEIARLLAHHRPHAVLLENVAALITHNKREFSCIIDTLSRELGYSVEWAVINAAGWVPQNRNRVYILAYAGPRRDVLAGLRVRDPRFGPRMRAALHPEDGSELLEPRFLNKDGTVRDKYTISEQVWTSTKARLRDGVGFQGRVVGPHDVAGSITASGGVNLVRGRGGRRPRRLTPRERSRMMGFDLESLFKIPDSVPDTQATKQFGNAVVVPVVRTLADHMAARVF